jgi:hypothetical protein
VAITLRTMRRLGAVITMASTIAMVPRGGSATTTIMTNTMTMMTTMMDDNVAGIAAGELGGHAGAHGGGSVHAQIKERR